ncbi:MAG: LysR substrate-binding domain-containing protein [Burkholderiaceae bacterium]|jgi:DNA-binding transcriptional LysR family regulator|nr:LysR substrate-binding domain-containing protein [Burkholderiaceae bacterium]
MRGASLRQLKAFATVARHKSFIRAAEELHLTPPAISLQVSQLEREVGLPLFERRGRTVSLTMPGEYLLVYARRILGTLKEAEDAMARLQGAQTGRITIGMVSTAKYFMPRLLARFREEHRGVELRMAIGNRETLVEQLRNAEVDLAVMGRPPKEIDARGELFAEQPHAIVASPLHRLAGLREITPAMLSGEEFIVREPGSGTRAAMEQFFRDHRIAPPQVMETTSNETIKQAVIANMGLAFLSLHTTGLEVQSRLMVVLDVLDLPMIRRWHIVHLQGKPLSPAAEALRYFVLEHGAALIEAQFGNGAQGQPSTRPRGEEEVAAPAGVDSAPPAARQAGAPVGARPRKRAAR